MRDPRQSTSHSCRQLLLSYLSRGYGHYLFVIILIGSPFIMLLNVIKTENLLIHGDAIIAHYTSKIRELAPLEDQRFNNSNACILSMHDGGKFNMEKVKGTYIYEQNKMLYAMNHGYTYHLHVPPQIDQLPFHKMVWKKPWMIDYFLNQHIDMTYFLWIDGDAFFNDMTESIEDRFKAIVKMYDTVNETFIIIGEDINGINAGVFLLKNSEWTRQFVANWSRWRIKPQEEWWDLHDTPFREQSTLKEMIETNHLDAKDHVLVLERGERYLLQSKTKRDGLWIVHHLASRTAWSLAWKVIGDHSSCC